MKKFKHLLTFNLFETADYTNDRYPVDMVTQDITQYDRSTKDGREKENNFQQVQNAFQEKILPLLKKVSNNYELEDAVKVADKFFGKTKTIKSTIDRNNGDIQKTVDELISKHGDILVQNYIKPLDRLNNPGKAVNQTTGEDFHPE